MSEKSKLVLTLSIFGAVFVLLIVLLWNIGQKQAQQARRAHMQELIAKTEEARRQQKVEFARQHTDIAARAAAAAKDGNHVSVVAILKPWEGSLDQDLSEKLHAAESAVAEAKRLADEKAAAAKELKDVAWASLALAKRKVPLSLKDPESARFRDLMAIETPAGGLIVCGEVNSKNSFGGYAGFSKFMFNSQVTVLEEQLEASEFAKAWNAMCGGKRAIASMSE